MWSSAVLVAFVVEAVSSVSHLPLRDAYPSWEPLPVEGEVGARLVLTPYIEAGDIMEARELSAVQGEPFPEDIPSYSGFLTVNQTYNSTLYFWFFPAEVSSC